MAEKNTFQNRQLSSLKNQPESNLFDETGFTEKGLQFLEETGFKFPEMGTLRYNVLKYEKECISPAEAEKIISSLKEKQHIDAFFVNVNRPNVIGVRVHVNEVLAKQLNQKYDGFLSDFRRMSLPAESVEQAVVIKTDASPEVNDYISEIPKHGRQSKQTRC
jgi:hypothetical protein